MSIIWDASLTLPGRSFPNLFAFLLGDTVPIVILGKCMYVYEQILFNKHLTCVEKFISTSVKVNIV